MLVMIMPAAVIMAMIMGGSHGNPGMLYYNITVLARAQCWINLAGLITEVLGHSGRTKHALCGSQSGLPGAMHG